MNKPKRRKISAPAAIFVRLSCRFAWNVHCERHVSLDKSIRVQACKTRMFEKFTSMHFWIFEVKTYKL
ncbi:hypothetical protein PUN28_013414 [Cardiocondyla obscurior]|uniref:Secreted protein n=1 Tax=Cardiocondyla obscurior TaxID=286306 RepID=A0AAW2F8B2_9HYME